jgi:O-antigen/teichoic acid export membrane protein
VREQQTTIPWVVIGALALGCNILAGHVEITYYTLIITAFYAVMRLILTPQPPLHSMKRGTSPSRISAFLAALRLISGRGVWLLAMVALGLGIGAVQFIPLFEFAGMNYRDGRASFEQVLDWGHPPRDVLLFLMPNFYGNPAQHSYFDVFTGQTVTQFTSAGGQPINTIDWGDKNYVEGASYLGILPLGLAAYAVLNRKSAKNTDNHSPYSLPIGHNYSLIFAILTLISLTFMFGLPTYGVLYYLFPGINQLHSPFRWIFAVTLGVAVLAAFGADALAQKASGEKPGGRVDRLFGYGSLAVGALIVGGLVVTRLFFAQVEPFVQRIVDNMALAGNAFSDARMFYSYQFINVVVLGTMLVGTGIVFLWAGRSRSPDTSGNVGTRRALSLHGRSWQIFAVGLVAVDLMLASWSFNPASDPLLLDFTPPAIEWLKQQPGNWRYTTIDDPALGERGKIMNANMGWRYELYDVRGYDSIIPKPYVEFMQTLAPQVQLDYNRVAPLYPDYRTMGFDFDVLDALQSTQFRLLNIHYVVTSKSFNLPEDWLQAPHVRSSPPWSLAYEDEAVRIWSHNWSSGISAQVINESELDAAQAGAPVQIMGDTGREKRLDVPLYQTEPARLVISETYTPGWRAFLRLQDVANDMEIPLEVEPAYGALQSVRLDSKALLTRLLAMGIESPQLYMRAIDDALQAHDYARVDQLRAQLRQWRDAHHLGGGDSIIGQAVFGYVESLDYDALRGWAQSVGDTLKTLHVSVRLVYSPASFQIGLFGTFISGVLLLFLCGLYLWRLFVAPAGQSGGVRTVARNSLVPIFLNLFNRGIDFGFAFIMLRVLGPEGAGIYYYAVFVFGWFDIFTNFGLNLFLTREVSRDRSQAGRILFNTSMLRLLLVLVGIPLLVGFLITRQATVSPPLEREAILALILLYIGLLPNSLSNGLSALFYAFEKAEYPAAVATIATICKAMFGVAALALGWGVIGLAGVSILTNVVTLGVLAWAVRNFTARQPPETSQPGSSAPQYRPDRMLIRGMVRESWPLMLNHFLATIFFQIDVVLIEAYHGARMVGQYSVAYKWVSALNVIPAFFTMALLPLMSRLGKDDRAALKRNYGLAIKLLVSVALPVAVAFTFMAYFLTGVLGGAEYLPDGAIATQLMIWSIPIGWINSLTQYVLIALDLQRRITWAFVIAVGFNIISNLILIPPYGYRAAALTTIASEAALLIPFALLLRAALGPINWIGLLWKPVAATLAMLGVLLVGWNIQSALALVGAAGVYIGVLLVLRPLDAEEWARLRPLLPGRVQQWVRATT